MDLNAEAAAFLDRYRGSVQGSVPWAFPTALKQSALDGSRDSLTRIESLLAKIREKYAPQEGFFDKPEVDAFLRLLAYYIGDLIAKAIKSPIDWYGYERAMRLPMFQEALPRLHWTSVIGVIGGQPIFPLAILTNHLVPQVADATVVEYVDNQVVTLQAPPPIEENERAREFLEAMITGKQIPGGLSYAKELRELGLDYSLDSLTKLQGLLDKIRSQHPSYEAFECVAARRNFMLCCAYYFGTCIARRQQVTLKWYTYEDARRQFDANLPHRLETMTICVLGDRLYYPVDRISAALFSHDSSEDLLASAQRLIPQLPPPIIRLRKPSAERATALTAMAKKDVVLQAGFVGGKFAALALSTYVAQGSQCPPVVAFGPDMSYMTELSFLPDGQEAGVQILEHNAENRPFGAMVLDGYANLPDGRKDALIVDLRCYAKSPRLSSSPMRLVINIPYRPSSHAEGLGVYAPMVLDTTLRRTELGDVLDAFYLGLSSHVFPPTPFGPAFEWERALCEEKR